jgi:hypothetical protein
VAASRTQLHPFVINAGRNATASSTGRTRLASGLLGTSARPATRCDRRHAAMPHAAAREDPGGAPAPSEHVVDHPALAPAVPRARQHAGRGAGRVLPGERLTDVCDRPTQPMRPARTRPAGQVCTIACGLRSSAKRVVSALGRHRERCWRHSGTGPTIRPLKARWSPRDPGSSENADRVLRQPGNRLRPKWIWPRTAA